MTNANNRWERVTALFEVLIDATTDEREHTLRAHDADDGWVIEEVRSLLDANDAADGRFDQHAMSRMSRGEIKALLPPDALMALRRVGAYDVIRKIGEGGMGAVYEAIRADDVYQQRVAIKTIARGADSSVIVARFRRERQILAELQHPNIAVLLDGGITDTGTPYFVMEFVDGEPIDQWCRSHARTIAQRLDLMQQVCRAVQHAHQRLVVHRDLKPQNVLVSNDGVVKLLDFGVAKLVEASGDESRNPAVVTQDGLTPMTAAYASPEQLRGDAVATAGDVYSLGVMLYELLAGASPFPLSGRSAARLADAVLTEQPLMPSDACTETHATECGEGGRTRLARRLAGELDAITMMAMRKESERRYSSVEALSEDIRRYLRGMPVAARPDTLGYRAQRFVDRNRWPVTLAAALAFLACMSGAIIARQSSVARREATRTARVSEFLQAVLGAADARTLGGLLPRLGPRASVGALLDSAVQRVPSEFADDPAVRARLYLTVGSSLITQSRMRDASRVLDSAMALSRVAYGEQSDLFALACLEAGSAALHRNQIPRAKSLVESAQQAFSGGQRAQTELYARALRDLSSIALVENEYGMMTRYAEETMAFERKRTSAPTLSKAVAYNRLGSGALVMSLTAKADSLYDASLAMLDQLGAGASLERLDVQFNRQARAVAMGKLARADSILSESERIASTTFGESSREMALFLSGRSAWLVARGDLPGANAAADKAIRIIDSIPEVVVTVRTLVYGARAFAAVQGQRWARADTALRRALADLRDDRKGIALFHLLMTHGLVLHSLREARTSDSVLARAEQVYEASEVRLPEARNTLYAARAMVFARVGDEARRNQQLANLPAEHQTFWRAFIKKEHSVDSTILATKAPR